ncbi:porin [Paraburkholderia caffeinilytica]|uniref:porin n=1 Tax=Paraburkholderia caffeinilytica TaxID=1761016 RepID=UPI0038B91885
MVRRYGFRRSATIATGIASCVSGLAAAQSSVTLYGSMDAGVQYVSNRAGQHEWGAEQAYTQTDRWGLYGVEDLGGGNRAIFRLEDGFSTITGALVNSSAVFNRQAYVGLSSNSLGTLTLGHQTPFNFDWLGPFSTMYLSPSWYMAHPGNIDELANTSAVQINNSVRYVSPNFYGLTLGSLFGFSNSSNFGSGRQYSLGAKFTRGPFAFSAVYSNETQRTPNLATGLGLTEFQGINLITGTYTANHVDNIGVGASYTIGNFLFHAVYTNVKLQRANLSSRYQSYDGGVSYQVSPYNSIGTGIATTTLSGMRWDQYVVSDVYSLSKSTQLYASVVYEHATGGAVASLNTIGPSSNGKQFVPVVGMHHSF